MKELHKLREMLCEELAKHANKNELAAGSLDVIHKLTDTIKNIDKIEMLEGGGYSQDGWPQIVDGDDQYRRGRYTRGEDGERSGRRDAKGRYSRDDGKDQMMRHMREMLGEADNDKLRDAIRKCMDTLSGE